MGISKIHVAPGPHERQGDVRVTVRHGAEERGLAGAAGGLVYVAPGAAFKESHHHVDAAGREQATASGVGAAARWWR